MRPRRQPRLTLVQSHGLGCCNLAATDHESENCSTFQFLVFSKWGINYPGSYPFPGKTSEPDLSFTTCFIDATELNMLDSDDVPCSYSQHRSIRPTYDDVGRLTDHYGSFLKA